MKGAAPLSRRVKISIAIAVVVIIAVAGVAYYFITAPPPRAPQKPIKIGFTAELTGGLAGGGKAMLATMLMWREDVNAKGGLLGRPVELVFYDDHSNPADVPSIMEKLITVDKVDIVMPGYATIIDAAATPVSMKYGKLHVAFFSFAVNEKYKYDRHFNVIPISYPHYKSWSYGFFEVLKNYAQPPPKTVAVLYVANEYGESVAKYVIEETIKEFGLELVHKAGYPPATTDFAPVLMPLKAINPDIVYIASYPPDSVGLIKAAKEMGLKPKVFGGNMVGLQYAPILTALGKTLNGVLTYQFWVPATTLAYKETMELVGRYQKLVPLYGTDELGYYIPPYAYARMQILQQAIEATGSLDDKVLADYIRTHSFKTVIGEISFDPIYGEFKEPRIVWVQFQGIKEGTLDEFKDPKTWTIVWPPQYKTAELIYPFPGWS
jgi:branched-chain amino acid transport system substrate-binding protein